MRPLIQIKEDISFNENLSGIIDVLNGAAITQFRHLRARHKRFAKIRHCLEDFFLFLEFKKDFSHFLFKADPTQGRLLVMVTSDEGFLGQLNNLIVGAALEQCAGKDELVVLGERGRRYLEDLNKSFAFFAGIGEEFSFAEARRLADYLFERYRDKNNGGVLIFYPEFVSLGVQEVETFSFLPCAGLVENLKSGQKPQRPLWLREDLYLPSQEDLLQYLVKVFLRQRLYDIFWSSKLSEWAARIIHTESSAQEISGIRRKLKLEYFRSLHEFSDKNIREIFTSSSKLRKPLQRELKLL